MKKIAKLSLVAAIAVAGFTSANAQSLEEAIKGVETSGSVVYRYNDYSNDVVGAESTQSNNYKVAANLASKVNDDVKFNSRLIIGSQADGGFVNLGNEATSVADKDAQADVSLSNVYFGYTGLANTTVNVGKQGLTTPWTVAVDSDGNEQTGTGILAMTTVGPVTLAGAYFNQTNLDASGQGTALFTGDEDIVTVGAITTVGPVTFDAWYLDAQDLFDSYTFGALAKFDVETVKLGLDARHTTLNKDAANSEDNSLSKITLTADAGLIDAKLAYAMTDKEGGLAGLDTDAVTSIQGWSVNANGKADADYWQAVIGIDLLSNLNLSANYVNVEWNQTTNITREQEEVYAQLLYKMSKNFSTYVRYGTFTDERTTAGTTSDVNDDVRGRLQVEYTF